MRKEPITTPEAVEHLQHELKNDKAYRESFKANIAMAVKEMASKVRSKKNKAGNSNRLTIADMHKIANDGAELFLQQFCDEIKYPKGR